MAIIKKIKEKKCQQGYREKGTLECIHLCGCKLIMAIMGNRMNFLKNRTGHYDLKKS